MDKWAGEGNLVGDTEESKYTKISVLWKVQTFLYVIPSFPVYRDNYNSLTSAKLPPKNGDGQLKCIWVDKKADKILNNIYASLELW